MRWASSAYAASGDIRRRIRLTMVSCQVCCVSAAATGSSGADPSGHPVCTKVTVAVACSTPSSLSVGPTLLSAFTGSTIGTLAAGQSTNCVFTLTLPTTTPSAYASQFASQVLHWTLTAS